MFGYDGLAVAMALTAILFSITFLVIYAYFHKRNKRYTGRMTAGGVFYSVSLLVFPRGVVYSGVVVMVQSGSLV